MVKSLPLVLTLGRLLAPLLLCPLIMWGGEDWRLTAAALFTLMATTDWADGWLARRTGSVSRWGEVLDPIADKVLVLLVLFALVARGDMATLTLIFAFLCVSRELLMAGLRDGVRAKGVELRVSQLSKWKTFLTYVACGLLILGGGFSLAGMIILGLSLIPSYITFLRSLRAAL